MTSPDSPQGADERARVVEPDLAQELAGYLESALARFDEAAADTTRDGPQLRKLANAVLAGTAAEHRSEILAALRSSQPAPTAPTGLERAKQKAERERAEYPTGGVILHRCNRFQITDVPSAGVQTRHCLECGASADYDAETGRPHSQPAPSDEVEGLVATWREKATKLEVERANGSWMSPAVAAAYQTEAFVLFNSADQLEAALSSQSRGADDEQGLRAELAAHIKALGQASLIAQLNATDPTASTRATLHTAEKNELIRILGRHPASQSRTIADLRAPSEEDVERVADDGL